MMWDGSSKALPGKTLEFHFDISEVLSVHNIFCRSVVEMHVFFVFFFAEGIKTINALQNISFQCNYNQQVL